MSPRSAKPGPALMIAVAVAGVLIAVLMGVLVVNWASESGGNQLGDPTFDVNAAFAAKSIAEDGPLLFQDLIGGSRDIYLQHLGATPADGWRAFRAAPPGAERRCQLVWKRDRRVFVEELCGSGREYPADGAGLEHYRVTVNGNKLVIDLRPSPGS